MKQKTKILYLLRRKKNLENKIKHLNEAPYIEDATIIKSNNTFNIDKLGNRDNWTGGIWKNGVWSNGTWEDGIWKNGTWKNGIWEDGTWENGIWKNGIWENGSWENGIWEDGTWEGGDWYRGEWKGGKWITGWIYDPKKIGNYEKDWIYKYKMMQSSISPKEYFKDFKSSSNSERNWENFKNLNEQLKIINKKLKILNK